MQIKVLHLKADGDTGEIVFKDNGYESSKELVGGYLEMLRVDEEIDMWLNEEGKLDGLSENFCLVRNNSILDVIVGDVFFASHDDEGNTTSLTDDMLERISKRFISRRVMDW